MTVCITETTPEAVADFLSREWAAADREILGLPEAGNWVKRSFIYKATVDEEIVGVIEFYFLGGVGNVSSLIVKRGWRNQGIGRQLMEVFERLASQAGCHKLFLRTPKSSPAVHFYNRLGYQIESELPDHYYHRDFVDLSKVLKED
ncbi:MAG: GNAT family N-acetyltransferase [Anaerolineae bacterium]